ncbi:MULTISPECIES: CDP-alcohol phosphatidyltransferase family protein [Haloferax]|uniref:CDP-alcohol phosphatidyltransferase family protein n=1 Tax=Haloferax marinum TaxID=2666143 RepID=A0A6A8G394_9EURY|nr:MULTISPECIES: CDP-alcohol phosphatidyltransferase family protein [Haloferax]KAB1196639.1 CDP-alcohol phosphatidyltransferase family protein [Haloferax sp. CBA1150]MRW95644.1 CDP-alcohol phosphatidyltransferase family protein [Haloferax marinum]
MSEALSSEATERTRGRLLGGGAVTLAATVSVGWGLTTASASSVSSTDAVTWTSATILVVVGLWAYTYIYAAENVADERGETAAVGDHVEYDTLGLPTGVTLFRGLLVAGIAGVGAVAALGVVTDWLAWGAAIGYGLAAALDAVDGFLARRLGRTTRLGQRLDTAVDAFGLLVAPLAGVVLGQLPWWYLSVGVARYVFVAGLWWRERTGRPTFDLPPRESRRVLAGLQMAVVPVALAPNVGDAWIPLVAGAAASGLLVGFGRDWLYVSGRLEAGVWDRPDTPTRD